MVWRVGLWDGEFLQSPDNHSPAPTLQRLNHTLGPAHNRPLTTLLHELHSRLNLKTHTPRRELPICQVAAPKVSGGANTLYQIRWSYRCTSSIISKCLSTLTIVSSPFCTIVAAWMMSLGNTPLSPVLLVKV